MRWGAWGSMLTAKECAVLIDCYIAAGVRTFDSANIYGTFTNERLLGEAFALANHKRDAFEVISKCGIEPAGGRHGVETKHYNYSKNYIIACVRETLADLQMEYIDTLLLHRPSMLMNYDEIAEAFSYLKKEGLVLGLGVSNFTQTQIEGLSAYVPVKHNQVFYSLFHATEQPVGFGQWMRMKGISVSTYSPVVGFEDCTPQQSQVLQTLAHKYGVSERSIAVAWVLKHDWVNGVVLGSASLSHVQQFLTEYVDLELEDFFTLLEAMQGQRVP